MTTVWVHRETAELITIEVRPDGSLMAKGLGHVADVWFTDAPASVDVSLLYDYQFLGEL